MNKRILIAILCIFAVVFVFLISNKLKTSSEKSEQPQSVPQTQPAEQSEQTSLTPEQIQELAYIRLFQEINGDISESMTYFETLFQAKPSSLLWTEQEIIKVAIYTVIVEESYKSGKELVPPEKYKLVHSLFLSGLSKYAEAMPILRYGIDHFNADKINQSTNLLIEGTEFIKQTTEELNKLQ